MAGIPSIAAAGGKGFFSYLKIFSFLILFIIISLAAVLHALEQKSWKPIIEEIGGNIVLTTNQLTTISEDIINNGGIISEKTGLAKLWEILFTYSSFIILFWMTIVWIKLFSKLYENTPFSYEGNTFANYLAGFLIFILFQIIFGFFYGAMLDNLHSADDALKVIYTPFYSFYVFIVAAYYIMIPAVDGARGVAEKLPV